MAARVPVKLTGTSGMSLLATTDDASMASPAPSAGAMTMSAGAMTTTSQRVQCAHKKQRSLAMTAGTGFVCDWDQRANMTWTSQYGGAYTRWTVQDTGYNNHTVLSSGFCQQQGCIWSSWNDPPSNARVTFGEVENASFARIDYAWCG